MQMTIIGMKRSVNEQNGDDQFMEYFHNSKGNYLYWKKTISFREGSVCGGNQYGNCYCIASFYVYQKD